MLRQTQTQKLSQKLSPQQIQLMKLLQVPTANLEERIKDELENNPALDTGTDTEYDPYGLKEDEIPQKEKYENEESHEETSDDGLENFDISEYLRDEGDMQSDYHLHESRDDDDEPMGNPARVETTFTEYLTNQLGMLDLDERATEIAEQIIGSIDDDGYLRREPISIADDLAFNRNIATDEKEVKALIKQIQGFDPAGVGAMDLKECLILQLKRLDKQDEAVETAIRILKTSFEEFSRKHYDKIMVNLEIEEDELKDAVNLILKLSPKPGSAFSGPEEVGTYVIPDFFVYNNNGVLELTLNARNAPELRISEGYREMLKTYDSGQATQNKSQRDALVFIKQKIDAARWFIDAIKQRQHTLLVTMSTILEFQTEFFLTGDESILRPMILRDIADRINMDISTVSRVASSKYVQCEYGTFLLKFFFSEAVINSESGEEFSTREVKRILIKYVDEEDKRKPLSDERLMELLAEAGFSLARRTIAKYREQLEIPVARLRRKI